MNAFFAILKFTEVQKSLMHKGPSTSIFHPPLDQTKLGFKTYFSNAQLFRIEPFHTEVFLTFWAC